MAKCKGCGAEIVWATSIETGAKIPLDPKAPTFEFGETEGGQIECWRATSYVSHFATCPNANDFSASKRREKS